jgi:hypothetical protein
MRKYQVMMVSSKVNTAASKAVEDIVEIAEKRGYMKRIIIDSGSDNNSWSKVKKHICFFVKWMRCSFSICNKSIVLLQQPFSHRQFGRLTAIRFLKKRNVKIVCAVHDVEELRKQFYNKYFKNELNQMIHYADVIIVHNDKMKQFFQQKGVSAERIVVLEVFDYLLDNYEPTGAQFEKSITFAGNLASQKSGYIYQLGKLNNIKVNLYGSNLDTTLLECDNIHYHGSVASSELPSRLTKGFGLVWDGTSISTCDGNMGNYLKYNNPHKLSLYLASGIPVIIWKEAAEAEFVRKYHLGICVDSLQELNKVFEQMNEDEYNMYVNSVRKVQKPIRKGFYMNRALERAEQIIDAKCG